MPIDLGLLLGSGKILGGLFRFAGVDRRADRTRGTEGKARKLQPDRGVERARADEVHRIGIGAALVEQFQAVVDGADRGNDVVANPAAQKRGQIGSRQCQVRIRCHLSSLFGAIGRRLEHAPWSRR
ncbi:hypothetical protein D3C87_1685070 [compost metagenome]